MVPVVAGVAVAEEEGRGDDAEEPHLEEQGVPLEPEERLAVVEEREVEVPHDEERRLVEEPRGAMGLRVKLGDNSRENFSRALSTSPDMSQNSKDDKRHV